VMLVVGVGVLLGVFWFCDLLLGVCTIIFGWDGFWGFVVFCAGWLRFFYFCGGFVVVVGVGGRLGMGCCCACFVGVVVGRVGAGVVVCFGWWWVAGPFEILGGFVG